MSDKPEKENEEALEAEAYKRNSGIHEETAEDVRSKPSGNKRAGFILAVMALLAAAIFGTWGIVHNTDKDRYNAQLPKPTPSTTTSTSQSPTAGPSPAPAGTCSPITNDPNKNYNVVSHVADDGFAVHNRAEDLTAVKGDARNLAERAWILGLTTDAYDRDSLVNGGCLSAHGMDLYKTVYEYSMGTSPAVESINVDENATAPQNLFNSGMNANGPVINGTPGIDGDRSAIHYVIKLKSGRTIDFYVLKRCGNPTFATVQTFPPVNIPSTPVTPSCEEQGTCGTPPPPTETTPPTTETTPPTTETTPPTTTSTPPPCTPPPGNTQCMLPKDPVTNESHAPGISPTTLVPRDTFDPTIPTLAPGTTRQTAPPSNTAAPPTHLNVTPRPSPPPTVVVEIPKTSSAPTSTTIARPPAR